MEEIIIQEKLLEINAKIFVAKLPFLNNLHGLNCDIFYNLPYEGNYDSDGKFEYDAVPNETRKLAVLNYFQIGKLAYELYDPFGEKERSILTKSKDDLPKNSKIVVRLGTAYYQYRVNDYKVFAGKDGLLLVENLLIPYI